MGLVVQSQRSTGWIRLLSRHCTWLFVGWSERVDNSVSCVLPCMLATHARRCVEQAKKINSWRLCGHASWTRLYFLSLFLQDRKKRFGPLAKFLARFSDRIKVEGALVYRPT